MILGIDEVGRGPWAGPLVVGAVVLPNDSDLAGLTDSKKLSAKKRTELDQLIRESALGWGLGWVHADEIDAVGLAAALRLATIRAVEAVECSYHEIIIDGTINFLADTSKGQFVTTLPKADALIPAVSAASIIAKVARDTFMAEQALVYPGYGFEAHVGYGTAKHSQGLAEYGVTPIHRRSFKPIAALIQDDMAAKPTTDSKKVTTTTEKGSWFEGIVADELTQQGYQIIERNWRTKYCEIDIIASHANVTYFVEAKYRSSHLQGGGIAAITAKKLQQMHLAAEAYIARHASATEYALMAAAPKEDGTVELIVIAG